MTRLRRNQLIVTAIKAGPCTDCGARLRPEAMDFDHVRGQKLNNVSDLVRGGTQALLDEIAKCELVCAVCHRLRTSDRRAEAHLDLALAYDVLLDE